MIELPEDDNSFNPTCLVEINKDTSGWYNEYLLSAEYESHDTAADKISLIFSNPNGILSDSGLLTVGNEISMYGGYGNNLKHFGRGMIIRVRDLRHTDYIPKVEVICFTKDYLMSLNEPKHSKSQPSGKKKIKTNRNWDVTDLSEVIKDIASRYTFDLDVDKASRSLMDGGTASITKKSKEVLTDQIIQPGNVSDLKMCSIIANEIGYLFWVDGDENGKWTLHFKNPETTHIQKVGYNYYWNYGELSDILEFDGEKVLDGASTLTVQFTDPKTKKLITVEVNALNDIEQPSTPERKVSYTEFDENETTKDATIKEPIYPNQIWIQIGEVAHKVITNRKFKSIDDVQAWATKWFKENSDNFMQSEVKVVGSTDVMAFNVVTLKGLGGGWDGDHYIYSSKHLFDSGGYATEFSCRKILGTDKNLGISIPILENPFIRKLTASVIEILKI
jgi:hypothetical protein